MADESRELNDRWRHAVRYLQLCFGIGQLPNGLDPVLIAQTTWSGPAGDGSSYKLYRAAGPITWDDASLASRVVSGELATISSQREQDFIDAWLAGVSGSFDVTGGGPWIGAKWKPTSTRPAGSWADRESFIFSRWAAGEPDAVSGQEGFGYLQRVAPGISAWADWIDVVDGVNTRDLFLVEQAPCATSGSIGTQPTTQYTSSTNGLFATSAPVGPVQWRLNGVAIPGATMTSYDPFGGLAPGFYDAVFTDPCGSALPTLQAPRGPCNTEYNPWSGASLQARLEHQIAWDSTTNRFIAFGGTLGSSMPFHFDDTLELVGENWIPRPVVGPSGRFDHAMCEAPGGGIVLFGGRGLAGAVSNETWLYRNGAWTELSINQASRPPARGGHEMVFDVTRNRVVMFGGFGPGPSFTNLGDTWEFDGSSWTQIQTAASPSPRFGHSMVFDPRTNKVLMFGGFASSLLGDTWLYDQQGWTLDTRPGPSARFGSSLQFDKLRNRLLLIGGVTAIEAGTSEQWQFTDVGWSRVDATFVGGGLWAHDAATNPQGEFVLAGGARGASPLNPVASTWIGPISPVATQTLPSNATVRLAVPSTFTVGAFGANLTYDWTLFGVNRLTDGNYGVFDITGTATNSVTITPRSLGNTGTFIVFARTACGASISLGSLTLTTVGCEGDIASAGGAIGADGFRDNNDFIVFINWFFAADARADIGASGGSPGRDGVWDNNDFIVFVEQFFSECD